jgi:DNA adenine methylase
MEAIQQVLFPRPLDAVVNVASVRQLSPFRYPGGKTWLVPRIRQWLYSQRPVNFVEPFAGGGIVSLSVAAENLADKAVMVELDDQVAAVWECIFDEADSHWLAERIITFDLNKDNVSAVLSKKPTNNKEMAFQTILKNRSFHGGILANGSGFIKHGENGKGIRSRWYPETLRRRILSISRLRNKIEFFHGDAFDIIAKYSSKPGTSFFIDPPYTAAGKKAGRRLYNHFDLDHEKLFRALSAVRGDVLMTYDDAQGVRDLADKYGFKYKLVAMKNTHHAEMKELIIGKNLDWV